MKRRLPSVNIIYTSAGGLGHTGILRAIVSNGERRVRVLCGDVRTDVPVSFLYPFRQFPPASDPGYIDTMFSMAGEFKADLIIPNHTDELLRFSREKERFARNNVGLAVNDEAVLRRSLDKAACFNSVASAGLPVPDFLEASTPSGLESAVRKLGYPGRTVCAKPSRYPHGGGRGFVIIRDKRKQSLFSSPVKDGGPVFSLEEVLSFPDIEGMPDLLVMEYLPGDEYSVYLFCDRGKVLYCIPQLRQTLMSAFSFNAVAIYHPAVIEAATAIAEHLGLEYAINIQLRMDAAGTPKLVEVNPRFAGALCLSAATGVNMPYLTVKKTLGEPVPQDLTIAWDTRMIRYWSEIFVNAEGAQDIPDATLSGSKKVDIKAGRKGVL